MNGSKLNQLANDYTCNFLQTLNWVNDFTPQTFFKKSHKIIRVRLKSGQFWVTQQCPNVKDKLLRRTFEHESWNSYRQLHTVTFDQMLKGNKRAYIRTKINAIFESKNSTYF